MPESPFRAAVVQHSPVFLDLSQSVEKACVLVEQAARGGAKLIAFPETWLPGYPVWLDFAPNAALWDYGPAKELYAQLWDNSITLDGPSVAALAACAERNDCVLVMGAHERLGGTLYNTMLYFDGARGLAGVHRKLMPTYTERLVWGMGDGSTLTVVDSGVGRVGGLICWEHWMPLARAAMHDRNELVHVAQWPMVKEMNLVASRHYAFEGQCFVLACGAVLTRRQMLAGAGKPNAVLDSVPGADADFIHRGGSAIIAPTGDLLAGPLWDEEQILMADIHPALAVQGRMLLDVNGHYSRPDVFRLEVNQSAQKSVVSREEPCE